MPRLWADPRIWEQISPAVAVTAFIEAFGWRQTLDQLAARWSS